MKGYAGNFDFPDQNPFREISAVWNRPPLLVDPVPIDEKTIQTRFEGIDVCRLFEDPDQFSFAVVYSQTDDPFDRRGNKHQLAAGCFFVLGMQCEGWQEDS